jgi:hypothetical protein
VPTWLIGILLSVGFAACLGSLAWAGSKLLMALFRRRELQRLDAGVLERLTVPGTDERRLSELRRLHDIVDSRLRRLGGRAPSLRNSLDRAMYQRTTQPEMIRRQIGGRRLPSVASITRLMDRLDIEVSQDGSKGESEAPLEVDQEQMKTTDNHAPADRPQESDASTYDEHFASEQRAHVGASLIGITGLCVVSTLVAASHNFELSSPAAIGLFTLGAVCVLAALWAFERMSGTVAVVGSVTLAVIGLVTGLIIHIDSAHKQVPRRKTPPKAAASQQPGNRREPQESGCPVVSGRPIPITSHGVVYGTVVLRYSAKCDMTWGIVKGLESAEQLRLVVIVRRSTDEGTTDYPQLQQSKNKDEKLFQAHGCVHGFAVAEHDRKTLARARAHDCV